MVIEVAFEAVPMLTSLLSTCVPSDVVTNVCVAAVVADIIILQNIKKYKKIIIRFVSGNKLFM